MRLKFNTLKKLEQLYKSDDFKLKPNMINSMVKNILCLDLAIGLK